MCLKGPDASEFFLFLSVSINCARQSRSSTVSGLCLGDAAYRFVKVGWVVALLLKKEDAVIRMKAAKRVKKIALICFNSSPSSLSVIVLRCYLDIRYYTAVDKRSLYALFELLLINGFNGYTCISKEGFRG